MRKCGHPGCIATNYFHLEGRADALGQWFCSQHLDSPFSHFTCDTALIIWVLKQQVCSPDIVQHICWLVVRDLDPTQLESTAKALYRKQQRQLAMAKPPDKK